MSYLLDTVMLSELRKKRPMPSVLRWVKGQRDKELFVSVVSIGEIERGIENLRSSDLDFAQELEQWLETLLNFYGDRILPIGATEARLWGRLSSRIGHEGADILIASTAISRGLTVVTRNTKHFEPTGARVLNPFENP
jgi:toxin FitB